MNLKVTRMDSRMRSTRRLYTCTHCHRKGNVFMAERYRVTQHVVGQHTPVEQAAFYCKACPYACSTMRLLEKHAVTARHLGIVRSKGGESRMYLGQNFLAKPPEEGIDFTLAMDPEEGNSGNEDEAGDSAEMVSIKVTPQQLAQLMGAPVKMPQVPEYDPMMPAMSTATTVIQAPSAQEYIPTATQQSPILHWAGAQDYAPSFGDTIITRGLDLEDPPKLLTPPLSTRSPLVRVGTPGPEVEDIREQLLGEGEVLCFSPPTPSGVKTSTKEIQTEDASTESPHTSVAIRQLGNILQTALNALQQSVERNSRRMEDVNKALGRVAEALQKDNKKRELERCEGRVENKENRGRQGPKVIRRN